MRLPALVRLACGMEESRPKAEAVCHVSPIAHEVTNRLEARLMLVKHRDMREEGEVIAGLQPVEVGLQAGVSRF